MSIKLGKVRSLFDWTHLHSGQLVSAPEIQPIPVQPRWSLLRDRRALPTGQYYNKSITSAIQSVSFLICPPFHTRNPAKGTSSEIKESPRSYRSSRCIYIWFRLLFHSGKTRTNTSSFLHSFFSFYSSTFTTLI